MPCAERGVFYVEGQDPVMVKLRDAGPGGVGAYIREPVEVGTRAVLSVRLAGDEERRSYEAEVRWCGPVEEAEKGASLYYPYRMGLFFVGSEKGVVPEGASFPRVSEKGAEPRLRVKGSMLLDFVKVIRRNRELDWDKYLTIGDREMMEEMIIPSKWYPVDVFRRAAMAVYELIGQGKPESARAWGRESVERIPEELYQSFFAKNDPKRAVRNWVNVNTRVFDFLRFRFSESGEKEIKVSITGKRELKKTFPEMELLALIIAGAIEEVARRNGVSAPRTRIQEEESGEALLSVIMSWE